MMPLDRSEQTTLQVTPDVSVLVTYATKGNHRITQKCPSCGKGMGEVEVAYFAPEEIRKDGILLEESPEDSKYLDVAYTLLETEIKNKNLNECRNCGLQTKREPT